MHAEDLRFMLALGKHDLMKGSVEKNVDDWCQEQKIRKMALKDELREKVLSMLEKSQKESTLLREENEELRKQATMHAEERANERKMLEEHMGYEAKVVSSMNSVNIGF